MPNTCAKRTGTLWLLSALAVGMVAAGCGKEASPAGGGGAGGSINPARNDAGGGRGGAGGSSSGSGGASSTGTGGTTGGSGITPVTGGSGAGGSGAGGSTGDAGPAANYNPPADKAVAKFCNGLIGENMMILEFGLDIGMQPVRLVAKSGECFPAVGQPCVDIPVGMMINVSIVDLADQMVLASGPATIAGGSQVVWITDIDQMSGMPYLGRQILMPSENCAALGVMPGPAPDGGAGPGPRPPLMP
jgi:hypothetical protein